MTALLLAAVVAASTPCTTVQPGPINGLPWRCVDGGWLPPVPTIAPPPEPTTDSPRFRVGRRYVRQSDPSAPVTDLFIAGTGQLADGNPVLFATCLSVGDGCYAVNYVRMLPALANAAEWAEAPLP